MPTTDRNQRMRILREPYKITKSRLLELLLLGGGIFYVILLAYVPVLQGGVFACPAHKWLNLNCPGCGLTRACRDLAHFDLTGATLENPLWIVVVPYVGYRLLTIIVGVISGRKLVDQWPRWFVCVVEYVFIATWLILAVVRVASWLAPGLNPHGVLLPL